MITKNYIKMCEQAEEIQKSNINVGKRHFSNQDFVAYNFGEGKKVYVCSEISQYWNINDLTWLPTQEQIIKIHFDWYLQRYKGKMSISEYLLYLGEFAEIAEESEYKYYSLKEMMLGYLYQEKYNKIWGGKEFKVML